MMQTQERPMARRKSESGKTAREGISVKIDRELHRKLTVIAAETRMDLYELVDQILRRPTEARYRHLFQGKADKGESAS